MDTSCNPANSGLSNLKQLDWRPFIYLGGPSHEPQSKKKEESRSRGDDGLPKILLATAKIGDCLQVVSLNCGNANDHLKEMGVVLGARFEVISSTSSGSVLVVLQDHQQLGLGARLACRIQVIQVTDFRKQNLQEDD